MVEGGGREVAEVAGQWRGKEEEWSRGGGKE